MDKETKMYSVLGLGPDVAQQFTREEIGEERADSIDAQEREEYVERWLEDAEPGCPWDS